MLKGLFRLLVGILIGVVMLVTLLPASFGQGQIAVYVPHDCRPDHLFLPSVFNHPIDYFVGPMEVEPNNTYLDANGPIRPDIAYSGHPNDPADYFSFYLTQPGPVTIDLSNHNGVGVQLQLFYQSTDNRVGYDPVAPYQVEYDGPAGWYYIYLYTASGHNNTTLYNLEADFDLQPIPQPVTAMPTPTCAATSTATAMSTATATPTGSATETPTPSATSSTDTPTDTPTPTPSNTPSITPTFTPSSTNTPTINPSYTPTPSNTPSFTPTFTPSPTPSPSPTPTLAAGWYEAGAGSASSGGISNNSDDSRRPVIAFTSSSEGYVVWYDFSSGEEPEIYVRRWNGNLWEEVGTGSASGGGISNTSGNSVHPTIAVAPNDTTYVAWWDDSSGNREIYVRRWNGNSWEEVGVGSASGGGISNNTGSSQVPSIAIAPDGTPFVAWYDDSAGNWEIYIRRWNGSNWVEVGTGSASGGGISNNSSYSAEPSVAISSDGTPYVTWYDDTDGNWEIFVRRWNGTSWVEVGTGSASGGGISNSSGTSADPAVVFDSDNLPYISWWDESSGDPEIYIRYWNSSNWVEVGTGSASGGGISNNSGISHFPTLAIASENIPYVSWWDNTIGNFEIYVRRWNGTNWEEVGINSATNGGISNNGGDSKYPSIALAPDGIPYIVWDDTTSGDYEIYAKRWLEP